MLLGNNTHRIRHAGHLIPTVEIKDCNDMIVERHFSDQSVKALTKYVIKFKNLEQFKEMITRLVA